MHGRCGTAVGIATVTQRDSRVVDDDVQRPGMPDHLAPGCQLRIRARAVRLAHEPQGSPSSAGFFDKDLATRGRRRPSGGHGGHRLHPGLMCRASVVVAPARRAGRLRCRPGSPPHDLT